MFGLKPVALDAADQARLSALQDKTQGVQRMISMFVESGERRLADLQKEGRDLFEELAKKHGLDITHVNYVPSPDSRSLIPVAVRLQGGSNGSD